MPGTGVSIRKRAKTAMAAGYWFKPWRDIFWLGLKELRSLAYDPVLVSLIVFTFTFAVYSVAQGIRTEVQNASIAIADEDNSVLSRRIRDAFLRPFFKTPDAIASADVIPAMDKGRYLFVLGIPRTFEADVRAGRRPTIQVNVDATAMTMAGNGALFVESVINRELSRYFGGQPGTDSALINVALRAKFNPSLDSRWLLAIMQLVSNVTMLSLVLSGAAVIREREHGTIEHLLVTPVSPSSIILAKIWANSLVVIVVLVAALKLVVGGVLGVRVAGSFPLFAIGTTVYLFAMTSLGVTLATVAKSMPQFGLLAIPFFVVMNMLSGGVSPLDGMPWALRTIMRAAPSTPYTSFTEAVLCRGASLDVVWPHIAMMTVIGAVFFAVALIRFRATMPTSSR